MNLWFAFYLAALGILALFLLEGRRASKPTYTYAYAGLGFVVAWIIAVPAPLLIMGAQAGMLAP